MIYKKIIPVILVALAVLVLGFYVLDFFNNTQLSGEIDLIKKELESVKAEKETLDNEIRVLKDNNKFLKKELENSFSFDTVHIFEYKDLVEVRELDRTIVVDLIYATPNNFTEQVLYHVEVCLLRKNTAVKLAAANTEFARDGYRIKVWDSFRPRSAQEIMWNLESNEIYVADPAVGSNHNRGTSVDVTLVDKYGNELEMPTEFDNFTEKASRTYSGMSEEAKKNMDYMTEVMVRNGLEPIRAEWWHFNDTEVRNYELIDITLEEWVSAYFSDLKQ